MKSNTPSVWVFALVLLLISPVAEAQRGARTLPRGLDQLAQEATLVVHGYVTSAKVEAHPQFEHLMTVVVSMQVTETLKGTPRKSIQFRQYVWDIRDQLDAARYMKGEELLLLLGPVSPYGLTSPVGLEQGRFRISRDSKGQSVAVNGTGNAGLFDSVAQRAEARGLRLPARVKALVSSTPKGAVPLADLEEAIRVVGK